LISASGQPSIFFFKKLLPYFLAGFDLTIHYIASRDDTTRPRRQRPVFNGFSSLKKFAPSQVDAKA
jgi:hypothetical protein